MKAERTRDDITYKIPESEEKEFDVSSLVTEEPDIENTDIEDIKSADTAAPKNKLEHLSEEIIDFEKDTRILLNDYYAELIDKTEKNEETGELYDNIEREIKSLKNTASNLSRARKRVSIMADELSTSFNDVKKGRRLVIAPPANIEIDYKEEKAKHFAQGINFYKLFLICFIGSFAGVIVELLWCLIRNGYVESRSGLVYGPFNLLYGAGAVALTLALYKYRNRNSTISFFGGMIVGSVLEYVVSWGQETFLGSRSWDYSQIPFNLNGRICLLYSVFWGILGVLWMKIIYPSMANIILQIPNKIGKIVTWILCIFMIFNVAVTIVTTYRWSQRVGGNPADNVFEKFIDERFPNERMEKIFANMKFD